MSQLSSMDPEQVGFMPGIPGHRLSTADPLYTNPAPYQMGDYKFTCSCGLEIHCRATKAGRASGHSTRRWRNHIESHSADPDEVTCVGVVSKQRVSWDVKVINRWHQYADEYARTTRYYKDWTNSHSPGWWGDYSWAVVIDRTSKHGKKSKAMHTIATSRSDAVSKAIKLMERQEAQGFSATYTDSPTSGAGQVVVPTFRNTFGELLTRTDVALAGDLTDIRTTMEEIDEVLGLIPVLQARRTELQSVWDRRTVGLLRKEDEEVKA